MGGCSDIILGRGTSTRMCASGCGVVFCRTIVDVLSYPTVRPGKDAGLVNSVLVYLGRM